MLEPNQQQRDEAIKRAKADLGLSDSIGLLSGGGGISKFPAPPFSIFAPKRWAWLHWLFWRKLCPQPDKPIFGSIEFTGWLYNFTGRIASRYHKKICPKCQAR